MATQVFTLTMLGTDTLFTPPELKNEEYPNGETLSLVATQIKTEAQAEQKDAAGISAYIKNEVEVINGPTTLGQEVGERIGRGVASLLKAVAREQTKLNLTGHSRGAVESILITHEMNGIQKLIQSCATLDELLERIKKQQEQRWKEDPANTTNDIVASLTKQLKENKTVEQQDELFKSLKKNMPDASINFFGIDPVPGDIYPITWKDQRFYTLPPIVKKAVISYYENERTDWGFTPIYVDGTDPNQDITLLSMPGHHGTGSAGSDKSQQGVKVSPNDIKATHVQKLLLFKMLHFLKENGVEFKEDLLKDLIGKSKVDLFKNNEFSKIYRMLYARVEKHREAYRAFNKTNYKGLGNLDHRRILVNGDYKKFHDYFFSNHGYVNEEHGKIMQDYFFKQLGVDAIQLTSLDEVVKKARESLVNAINSFTPDKSSDLSASFKDMDAVLANKEVREDVLSAYGGLIHQISQKYLTSDWSSEQQQTVKKKFFTEIKGMLKDFNSLAGEAKDNTLKEFINGLTEKSMQGLGRTVKEQYKDLENDIKLMTLWPERELESFFNRLYLEISEKTDLSTKGDEFTQLKDKLFKDIFESEDFRKLKDKNVNDKIDFIWKKMKDAISVEQSKTISVDELKKQFHTEYGQKPEDYEPLYNRLKIFTEDLEGLSELVVTLEPEIVSSSVQPLFEHHELLIRKKIDPLVHEAAKRFYSNATTISIDDLESATGFKKEMLETAIKHYGALDPIKELNKKLTKETNELNNILSSEKERECLKLIHEQLLPLSKNYIKHLNNEIEFNLNAVQAAKEKRIIMGELNACLVHSKENPRPSERIKQFYTLLDQSAKKLGEHRDPAWQRYIRTAVTLAGILITAILPGLTALAIYSNIGPKESKARKSTFFWRSQGENLVKELMKDKPEEMPKDKPDDELKKK